MAAWHCRSSSDLADQHTQEQSACVCVQEAHMTLEHIHGPFGWDGALPGLSGAVFLQPVLRPPSLLVGDLAAVARAQVDEDQGVVQ